MTYFIFSLPFFSFPYVPNRVRFCSGKKFYRFSFMENKASLGTVRRYSSSAVIWCKENRASLKYLQCFYLMERNSKITHESFFLFFILLSKIKRFFLVDYVSAIFSITQVLNLFRSGFSGTILFVSLRKVFGKKFHRFSSVEK